MNCLGLTYLYEKQFNEAKGVFKKLLRYARRKKDINHEILKTKIALSDIDESIDDVAFKDLEQYNDNIIYYEHWYLASLIKNNNDSIQCLKISKNLLQEKVSLISDKNHQKSFLENIKLHSILT